MAAPVAVETGSCFEGVDHEAVAGAGRDHGGFLRTRAARRGVCHLLIEEKLASGCGQGREAVNGVPGPRCSVGVGLLPWELGCRDAQITSEVIRGLEGCKQALNCLMALLRHSVLPECVKPRCLLSAKKCC